MGIKGIYKEIGPGKRVSLCKLAVDHLEQTGQPLRLAIDFAIWSFQAQAARGGANPAIRTLFYRLLRLLSLTITPVFVFDGPQKPAFKRHRRSRGTPGDTVSAAMAKRLIRLFGFAAHDAPGEAEAECALLQRRGVVDAVLSEDVDTIMFGCARTLRAWTPEPPGRGTTPTHVSVYDVADLRLGGGGGDGGPALLDREGMVLVALMSGGDYLPEGVPGCGVKVACEAARAGFGRRLCRIKRADAAALRAWREDLARELRTNEGGFFRVRHRALAIPEDFPDVEVLRYYTHPVVSQDGAVERLRREMATRREIDVVGLRAFTAETFDWAYRAGAVKFIRVFAPSLLVRALLELGRQDLASDDPEAREEAESRLVRSIRSRRTHASTDETPELRVVHVPNDIVGVDLDAEEDEVITSTSGRSGLALNSDDEDEDEDEEDRRKSGPKKVFDPLQPDLAWVPETVAKLGVPLTVEDWEGRQRAKRVVKNKKAGPARRLPKKASDMPAGALDRFVKTTKPKSTMSVEKQDSSAFLPASSPPLSSSLPFLQQFLQQDTWSAPKESEGLPSEDAVRKQSKSSKTSRTRTRATASRPPLDINPWSIASSQVTPKATRTRSASAAKQTETILISSSPLAAPSPPPATSPAATNSNVEPGLPSSVLFPVNDNSRSITSSQDPFSPGTRPPPFRSSIVEEEPTLGKHNRSSGEVITKPAAKRSQRSSRASATLAARGGSPPPRRSARNARPARKQAAQQPSIKSFGRLSESMGKTDVTTPTAKRSGPEVAGSDDDDEDGLEDLRDLVGPTRPSRDAERALLPSCSQRPASKPIEARRGGDEQGRGGCEGRSSLAALDEKKKNGTAAVVAVIEIPSSPPAAACMSSSSSALAAIDSPFLDTPHKTGREDSGDKTTTTTTTRQNLTRLYIPRTSDAGLGYFREVEVSREEADRLLREEEARRVGECLRGQRPGGRRMWRESEVSILDLTGED